MLWVIREGVSFVSILLKKKKSFCEVWDFFIASASSGAARDQSSVSTFKYSPAQFFHISQHDCFKKMIMLILRKSLSLGTVERKMSLIKCRMFHTHSKPINLVLLIVSRPDTRYINTKMRHSTVHSESSLDLFYLLMFSGITDRLCFNDIF